MRAKSFAKRGLAIGITLGLAHGYVEAGHVMRVYKVTVKGKNATTGETVTFEDCFRFNTPTPGDLFIDLLSAGPVGPLTYRHGGLDKALSRFKAVSRANGFEIMFYGSFLTDPLRIRGEAVDEGGNTYVFSGRKKTDCVAAPPTAATLSPPTGSSAWGF